MKKQSRVQPTEYSGRLSEYQLYGNPDRRFVEYERDEFNAYQNFLYKRALFGLSVYSTDELSIMHWDKKKRILKVHTRTQNVLNLWKQEMINSTVNKLLSNLFYHSAFVKEMIEKFGSDTDPEYISRVSFKDLGVSKKAIVTKLIEEKILPVNFYELE
ncbi:hypothetical protein EBU95_16985 [bacterium]|nr:hypothetical protein [bacterium]